MKVLELKNVPILSKILWDLERIEWDTQNKWMSSKYIQNVFIKYTFPLDDEPLESDYIMYPSDEND